MTFVQIIDCKTDKIEQMNQLMELWIKQTEGRATATHSVVGRDRGRPDHVVEIVEFPSYEEAMRNSEMPETNRIFAGMAALCEEPPAFTDLDVVRDEQLNKRAARRYFETVADPGSLDGLDAVLAAESRAHTPTRAEPLIGLEAEREEIAMFHEGFDFSFTVEDQMAEGDKVTTRWNWRGKHKGEFMGIPATNRECAMAGITIHRFRDGKAVEGWWNFDLLGLMRQLGYVHM